MLAVLEPLPSWLNFLIVAGCMVLGAVGSLIWFVAFRKKGKRKRKHHHSHEKRPLNPTLAETGGLPPKRDPGRAAVGVTMQHSRAITRKSASNLALAFILLPRPKRDAMSALYAFCREVDDVADDESVPTEQRRAQLAAWREDIHRAVEIKHRSSSSTGIPTDHPTISSALCALR